MPAAPVANHGLYIGTVGDMTLLVTPNGGIAMPMTRGGGLTQLIDGGNSAYAFSSVRRTHTYAWDNQNPDDAATVGAFWDGLRGPGPFILLDPAWRNFFTLDTSSFGKRFGVQTSTWSVPSAATTNKASIADNAATPAFGRSGVALLSVLDGGNSFAFEGDLTYSSGSPRAAADVDTVGASGTAIPRIPGLAQCVSVYAKLNSGSVAASATLNAVSSSSTPTALGSLTVRGTSGPVALSSSLWLPLVAPVTAAAGGTTYISAYLVLNNGTGSGTCSALLSCASHELGTTTPRGWVQGYGAPRVNVSGDNPVESVQWPIRSQSLVFAEA